MIRDIQSKWYVMQILTFDTPMYHCEVVALQDFKLVEPLNF